MKLLWMPAVLISLFFQISEGPCFSQFTPNVQDPHKECGKPSCLAVSKPALPKCLFCTTCLLAWQIAGPHQLWSAWKSKAIAQHICKTLASSTWHRCPKSKVSCPFQPPIFMWVRQAHTKCRFCVVTFAKKVHSDRYIFQLSRISLFVAV